MVFSELFRITHMQLSEIVLFRLVSSYAIHRNQKIEYYTIVNYVWVGQTQTSLVVVFYLLFTSYYDDWWPAIELEEMDLFPSVV